MPLTQLGSDLAAESPVARSWLPGRFPLVGGIGLVGATDKGHVERSGGAFCAALSSRGGGGKELPAGDD
jgi:hypothetical protein